MHLFSIQIYGISQFALSFWHITSTLERVTSLLLICAVCMATRAGETQSHILLISNVDSDINSDKSPFRVMQQI